jgi:murein L,D-transpeptidase YcbB/YkuD
VSTVSTPEMRKFAEDWRTKCGLSSAVMSGIVGDLSHQVKGGFHISRQDQSNPNNYSVVRPEDKSGNGADNAASAVDMTLNAADMKTCTARLVTAFSNTLDPRRKYLNAFNGWTGSGSATRWDVYARTTAVASADHKWHVHLEFRRKYSASPTAMAAVLSILKGASVAAYLASIGVKTTTPAASKVPAYPGHQLRRNDKQAKPDPNVKLFQARMIARGWTSLKPADGFFGAGTERVVKAWQKQIGLSADGVIGPATWPTPWTRPLAK